MKRYSLAIFDLDGTLADSLPWFLGQFNGVADRFGFQRVVLTESEGAQLALSELGQELRHAGSREIVKRLGVPFWKLPGIARHMRRLKSEHIERIPLFPGTDAMLRALADAGVRLSLVSTDNEANARRQLGEENALLFSDFACGASLFGKAAKFRRVVHRAGINPGQAISIGDEVRDIEAARAAGIACGAVTWGYAAPAKLRTLAPDFLFDRMEDIAVKLIPVA